MSKHNIKSEVGLSTRSRKNLHEFDYFLRRSSSITFITLNAYKYCHGDRNYTKLNGVVVDTDIETENHLCLMKRHNLSKKMEHMLMLKMISSCIHSGATLANVPKEVTWHNNSSPQETLFSHVKLNEYPANKAIIKILS